MSFIKGQASRTSKDKKTAMCSFRVDRDFKQKLKAVAQNKGTSLSTLIEKVLENFIESQKAHLYSEVLRIDRRRHWRKEVLLPARWRLHKDRSSVEHDVLIRNISIGGAYTEYMNGEHYKIFANDRSLSLGLVARLPGSQEPVVLDCKPVRFHITRDSLGVGLRYTRMMDETSQISLNKFLAKP